MRITLHIGLEKTGTTSIQAFLARNHARLRESGVLYPASAAITWPAQAEIQFIACDERTMDDTRILYGRAARAALLAGREAFRAAFARELEATRPDHVILSREQLSSRLLTSAEVERLAAFVREWDPSPRIVLYLREQSALVLSRYHTSVRAGAAGPLVIEEPQEGESAPEAWFRRRAAALARGERPRIERDMLAPWLDYEWLLELWSGVFGREAVTLRFFDRARLIGGDAVADFVATAGLAEIGGLEPVAESNVSASARALRLMRAHNALLPPFLGERRNPLHSRRLLNTLSRAGGSRLVMPATLGRRIREVFAPSNAAAAQRYN